MDGVHAALFLRATGSGVVALHFHGTGGSVHDTLWHLGVLARACACHVAAVEYRGHGRSRVGGPSERRLVADSCAVARVVRERFPAAELVAVGCSLGSAVAAQVLAACGDEVGFAGVALENPFSSLPALAPRLLRWLLLDRFDGPGAMASVRVPLLVITSERDEVVPPAMSVEMLEASPSRDKRHVILRGCNHGDAGAHPEFLPALEQFFRKFGP